MVKRTRAYVLEPTYVVDEKNGRAIVHFWCRLEDGRTALIKKSFTPYFFIKEYDEKKATGFVGDVQASFERTALKTMQEEPVVKVITSFPSDVPKLRESFEKQDIQCYEADIRFSYRAMMDWGVHALFSLSGGTEGRGDDVDVIIDDPDVFPVAEEYMPQLSVLSFDIESDKDSGELFCLSCYGKAVDGKVRKQGFIVSREPVSGAMHFPDEKSLLGAFVAYVNEQDPDVITGWNVIDFDLQLLHERMKKYKVSFAIGRDGSELKMRLQSGFFRDSSADARGRIILDGIQLLKNSFIKLQDYKLDTAAKAFAKEGKLIQSTGKEKYQEIRRLYDEDKRSLLAYNLLDAKLAYDVIMNSGAFPLTIKRSLLVGMPLDRVNASIASLDSLYLRELRARGYVAPIVGNRARDDEGIGGFVMQSTPGIYDYVIVCDFKSLYPSLMRTFNIDPLMFVPEKEAKQAKKGALIRAPNGAYFRREIGIVPRLIQRFWDERDKARKAGDELARYAIKIHMNSLYGVLASPNCRFFNRQVGNAITSFAQHFIKLTAKHAQEKGFEVIYGDSVGKDSEIIIQDDKGVVSFVPIAGLFGRVDKRLGDGKQYSFLKGIRTLTIDKDGRSVFRPLRYVMRHKTNKQVYRVHFTNDWSVDVTEDHSLIGYINKAKRPNLKTTERLVEVKPTRIGTDVKSIISLKTIPQGTFTSKDYPKIVYEFMGYFVGDGSFQRNNAQNDADKDYYLGLSLGKDAKEIFAKLIKPLMAQGYVKNYWWSKTRNGDVKINGQKMVAIISKHFRTVDGKKTIPDWLLHEKNENISAFLRGLFSADGTVMLRNESPIIKYTSISDEYIEKVRKLLFLVGVSHSVFRDNTMNKFKDRKSGRTYSTGSHSKNIVVKDRDAFMRRIGFLMARKNKVAKIRTDAFQKRSIKHLDFDLKSVVKVERISYDDYVYDLEVEDTHRFFANNVLVHNTDSVFINLSCDSYDEAQGLGKQIEKSMNAFLKKYIKEEYAVESFMELEFEKTFIRFIMPKTRGTEQGAKKRYAGLVRTKDGKEDISFTGLEMVRRDWTDLAKEFQYELYRRVFKREEVAGYVKEFINDLKNGAYDDKLVYRKALRKDVAAYTKTTPPHVKAALKLGKVESDLIEYVMTSDGPEPVQKLEHDIDYEHYIDKQLKPIADSILGFYNTSFDEQLSGTSQASLFDF